MRVTELPVLSRIGKGVLMTGYRRRARRLVAASDVIVINYPITPPETGALLNAAAGPGARGHRLPMRHRAAPFAPQFVRATLGRGLRQATAHRSARVIVLSRDYAETSRLLQPHLRSASPSRPPSHSGRPRRRKSPRGGSGTHPMPVPSSAWPRASARRRESSTCSPLAAGSGDFWATPCLLIVGEKREGLGEGRLLGEAQTALRRVGRPRSRSSASCPTGRWRRSLRRATSPCCRA